MKTSVDMFGTSTCAKCEKLSNYLSKIGVAVSKKLIENPAIRTKALTLKIVSVPALFSNGKVLIQREIFEGDRINEKKIKEFLED